MTQFDKEIDDLSDRIYIKTKDILRFWEEIPIMPTWIVMYSGSSRKIHIVKFSSDIVSVEGDNGDGSYNAGVLLIEMQRKILSRINDTITFHAAYHGKRRLEDKSTENISKIIDLCFYNPDLALTMLGIQNKSDFFKTNLNNNSNEQGIFTGSGKDELYR